MPVVEERARAKRNKQRKRRDDEIANQGKEQDTLYVTITRTGSTTGKDLSWMGYSDGRTMGIVMNAFCPLGNKECRHASSEHIRSVQRVGVIKTGTYERRETVIDLGVRCNDHGNAMAKDLEHCPHKDIPPVKPLENDLLRWAAKRGI